MNLLWLLAAMEEEKKWKEAISDLPPMTWKEILFCIAVGAGVPIAAVLIALAIW